MALKKKLYYNIQLSNPSGEGMLIKSGPGVAVAAPVAIRFVVSSGTYPGVADPDRYFNLLEPNQYVGSSGNGAKTRQAIGAWFAVGSLSAGVVRMNFLTVDFINETGTVSTTPAIDPATSRRPRVRLRTVGADFGAGSTVAGTLYVQRQHSIEV